MDASQQKGFAADASSACLPIQIQSKILGTERAPIFNPDTITIQQNNTRVKAEESVENQQNSDTESQPQAEDQLLSNDEQSSEQSNDASMNRAKSYPTQRSKLSSPNSLSENTVDDRRIRRQIANCNERRRMQSINAGFQALRQFLPQRCGEKLSKAAILQQTAELIQNLQLERSRRPGEQCRPTSDEEANAEDRPQCKKRRIAIKNEQKESGREEGSPTNAGHSDTQMAKYLKIIEELQSSLEREQNLRLLYERKLVDLKTTLSASLSFGSLPGGINLDRSEHTQQTNTHQRSVSADGLIVPKNICEIPSNSTSSLLNSNLAAVTEAALVQNMRMRSASGNLAALLSPNQINGLHFGAPLAQQILSNQNVVNLLAASLQSTPDLQSLNGGQGSTNQSPSVQPPAQNILFAIAEAMRQIENSNSKNFSGEGLSTDVLVR